jgi:hypothetical protein
MPFCRSFRSYSAILGLELPSVKTLTSHEASESNPSRQTCPDAARNNPKLSEIISNHYYIYFGTVPATHIELVGRKPDRGLKH